MRWTVQLNEVIGQRLARERLFLFTACLPAIVFKALVDWGRDGARMKMIPGPTSSGAVKLVVMLYKMNTNVITAGINPK